MANFIVNSSLLREALLSINPVIPKKPSRDVLKCVKVIAKSGRGGEPDTIKLMATDMEIFVVLNITSDVLVSNEGKFLVPCQTFLDYVKSIDGANLNIDLTDDETIKLSEAGSEFEVGTQDDEFPAFPVLPSEDSAIEISLEDMSKALNKVVFAVAEKGSPRWGSLSAVCIEINEKNLTLIGTDQHRASLVDIEIDSELKDRQFLVSAKHLALLPKVLNSAISLYIEQNNLIFKSDDNYFFVRLMHGNYPAVRNFVPSKYPNSLDIEPQAFSKQVRKAALAADEHSSIKLVLENNEIKLYTKTRRQRKEAKIIYNTTYSGDKFAFSLNCKFLIDLLKVTNNQETLKVEFNQNNRPILFSQGKFRHVCVPLETR
jgi:DNA polymerase-3 subunit beta